MYGKVALDKFQAQTSVIPKAWGARYTFTLRKQGADRYYTISYLVLKDSLLL